MTLPPLATRYAFFTGKGGVGKTSLSCAAGLALADAGRRVLIVSTDPASNLDEVLGTRLSGEPTAIAGAAGLFALNIDPEAAARAYRERMVAPYRGVLPAAAIASMEEQFSGACTVEIAAFDEFAKLLGDADTTAGFDHVIFDTAPTGHTLRLLTLPSAWSGFIASSTGGASCLGPLAGLERQKALYAATVARLSDPATTTVVLVSRPEASALREAERTRGELAELGVANLRLALNGVFDGGGDAIADAMTARGRAALAGMPAGLAALPRSETALMPVGTVGLAALRRLNGAVVPDAPPPAAEAVDLPGGLDALVAEIAASGSGVVLTMGKGGVGKTSVAAAIAVALAGMGHRVTLSTTDPAAHVAQAVEGKVSGLEVTRIDPEAEVAAYRDEVMEKAGAGLDAAGRAMLDEDLRSPCTEEIAVFRAFARTVDQGRDRFVVLDTAPTGHTILLLDAAEAYHREVLRTQAEMPEAVRGLLPRLRDPGYTRAIIVTLAEATPVHEAEALARDLERAGILPFAWVINQSLFASGTIHPLLRRRGAAEIPFIRRVSGEAGRRSALIPWQERPLVKTETPMDKVEIRDAVRRNYGAIAVGEKSGCCAPAPASSSSCCAPAAKPAAEDMALRMGYGESELAMVPDGANLGLGCGNPQAIAALKPGEVVVDLGSGAGFDCFLAAGQVGPSGRVIGVDMTHEMLAKARANAAKVGAANVEFRLGEIEHLPIADNTADVIISNCVVNLSPDKPQVLREAFRVLKSGGRVAISDVVNMTRLPDALASDPKLLCGCVAGAAARSEMETWLAAAGFTDIRIVEKPESRDLIKDWAPGTGIENYVVSATIEARKP
ncbi:arsenical pump-driving ATPase [Magnetospirillum sp. UT-4]|uniref:arsenical pump-driving ATPase n=1 Tax=Magnetospirillum sp. UT-4 TaxID=2681467 RepID=UPI00137D870F|nr:arsenical pump-driving ATPase [Magnetospirillum sp. UT-4]CAA7618293.1 Arsenical pump-driving ATPase (modular protein) [Magnetospirillum sp. UT-4]